MKKFYLINFLFLFMSTFITAQPTITSGMFYTAGTSVTTDMISNASSLSPGNSGANQTWNFASAIPSGTTNTNTFLNVAGTPYAGSYPGTNLSAMNTSNGTTTYSYYTHSSTQTVFNGFAYYDGTIPSDIIVQYSNPHTQMVYPATYNTTINDTYASTYSFVSTGITTNNFASGSMNAVMDGYGTLITPSGTYTNVLRMKAHQELYDSTVFVGFPPATIREGLSTRYVYFQVVGGQMIDRFALLYDTLITDFGTFTTISAMMTTGTTIGIFENSVENINAAVYPNPASEMTYIDLPSVKNSEVNVEIYDYSGRLLHSDAMIPQQGRIELPVSMLTAGMYMVRVNQDEKYWSGQVIKQ